MNKWIKKLIYRYLRMLWHNSAELNNQIFSSYVELAKKAKVLDIGCDEGTLILERISDKINHPIIYGMEIGSSQAKNASKKGILVTRSSAEKTFPFQSNFFDVVSANQIIEHLVNVDTFTQEIYRVLKPGGYVVLATENLSSWHNIFALVLGWQAFSQHISIKSNIGNPLRLNPRPPNLLTTTDIHIKIFTPRGLRELFELYGFIIEQTFGVGHYPFPPFLFKTLSIFDTTHGAFIGIKARKPIKK